MTPAMGARLGPYEILSALGAGGMREVYKARDTRLNCRVALKVLPSLVSEDPEPRARFQREAQAIPQLQHPHICALYDVGSQDGIDFRTCRGSSRSSSRVGSRFRSSGAVSAVQRTSSDLRLNPHLHVIALDGAWREEDGELAWEGLRHLRTSEVGEVLERVVRRMERHLRRSGQLRTLEDEAEADGEGDPEGNLAASAVSGQSPPAGPQWVSRLAPLEPQALAHDKPLCASLDGFTLHAATRAGALDPAGREALLHYVLRPPVAQERVEQRPDGLVRITLKKAYRDGTIAVDMDQAVSAVPAGLKRASTAVPHREVRGGAGPGQPVTRSFECSAGRTGRPGMACIVVPVR